MSDPTAFSGQLEHQTRKAHCMARSAHWLALGNAAEERGNKARAESCYSKSEFWLDRYNRLEARGCPPLGLRLPTDQATGETT
jgi:hypothetical protein